MELAVAAHIEMTQVLTGTKKAGPSSGFMERAKALVQQRVQEAEAQDVTPEELWGGEENG